MAAILNDKKRISYLLHCIFHRDGFEHAKWLKKHRCFAEMGEHCFYQPYNFPQDAKQIKFGDNVVVASGVSFIGHDVIHHVFNFLYKENCACYRGIISIGDNVFIGSHTTILYNVHI